MTTGISGSAGTAGDGYRIPRDEEEREELYDDDPSEPGAKRVRRSRGDRR